MWIVYFLPSGSSSGGIGSGGLPIFFVGLVDRTCFLVWTMCTFMVSLLVGQYFEAFWYVSPGHDVKLPALIALSQVSLTGKPTSA